MLLPCGPTRARVVRCSVCTKKGTHTHILVVCVYAPRMFACLLVEHDRFVSMGSTVLGARRRDNNTHIARATLQELRRCITCVSASLHGSRCACESTRVMCAYNQRANCMRLHDDDSSAVAAGARVEPRTIAPSFSVENIILIRR